MKKLIVTANPSKKSFTHVLAARYIELCKDQGHEVEILDLYDTELRQDFLRFEDRRSMELDETTKALQRQISEADEIVLIFPIWWGDMPAILKNWMDSNFLTGFAFEYRDGKSVGLLKGKTARIIATSGAPSFFYTFLLHIQLLWNMNRIGFCGIKQKSFTVFENIDRTKTDRSKYLESLEKLV